MDIYTIIWAGMIITMMVIMAICVIVSLIKDR